jgi:MFS transporter, putative metabolite:H+ symporter
VYWVSVVPLVLLAWARRELRETARFTQSREASGGDFPWLRLWRSAYRPRMLQIALLWFVCHVPASLAVAFFKQYAVSELHWSDAQVGNAVVIGAVGSLPLVFLTGRVLDSLGRRVGGPFIFLMGALGIAGTYQLSHPVLLTIALTLAMYAAIAFFHVTNAVTTELFPTELRSDAYAWCNNIMGRCGYVLAPLVVGIAAGRVGWGNAVAPFASLFLVAIWLLLRFIPETAKRELEDSARLE